MKNYYLLSLILLITISFVSCTPSNTTPPLSDSIYVVNKLATYYGSGDSSGMRYMERNEFSYDSVLNQTLQTIYDSTSGDPNPVVSYLLYQYDVTNRLTALTLTNTNDPTKNQHSEFEYDGNGELLRASFAYTGEPGEINEFVTTIQNGGKVIDQYDTLGARPTIMRYLFNAQGKLVSRHMIGTENGGVVNGDTADNQLYYDADDHLTQVVSHISTNAWGVLSISDDNIQIVREATTGYPVNDLAFATLRNVSWLTSMSQFAGFASPFNAHYDYVNREMPVKSTYEDNGTSNYTTTYNNSFDSRGLLTESSVSQVEHNIYGNTDVKNEARYYNYLKLKR